MPISAARQKGSREDAEGRKPFLRGLQRGPRAVIFLSFFLPFPYFARLALPVGKSPPSFLFLLGSLLSPPFSDLGIFKILKPHQKTLKKTLVKRGCQSYGRWGVPCRVVQRAPGERVKKSSPSASGSPGRRMMISGPLIQPCRDSPPSFLSLIHI